MGDSAFRFTVSKKQWAFVGSDADEVLFGGAAGGGKSHGQLVDAWLFAMRWPGSRQLVLRRTYAELEMSLVRGALALYPAAGYSYNASRHCMRFANGSLLDFGHLESENDVLRYQSAEYDVVRFDELTHFSRESYLFLLSRVRGVSGYPKQVKSTTNPGGPGHLWVKERFVDPAPSGVPFVGEDGGRRVFLPARLRDNPFLVKADPGYADRLARLPERERRAFLEGAWELPGGRFFAGFERDIHVEEALSPPPHWPVVRALDYGLDMLACYWAAVDEGGRLHVFREVFEPGLVISAAAERIRLESREDVFCTFAPPDLWNRRQETGRSAAEIFAGCGVPLVRVSNDRRQGWLDLQEWLLSAPRALTEKEPPAAVPGLGEGVGAAGGGTTGTVSAWDGGDGARGGKGGRARIVISAVCKNLILSMEGLQCDPRDPGLPAGEPHHLTHAPDALRYLVAGRPGHLAGAGRTMGPGGRGGDDGEGLGFERQAADFLAFGG